MKPISVQEFVTELHVVLKEVSFELDQRQSGIPGVGSIGELERIRNELAEVESNVTSGSLPPSGERWLASSRIVTDTWPSESTLGNQIVGLATKYRRQLE